MVEASGADLVAKLQAEGDWHRAAVFTDAEECVAKHNCDVQPDEIK